MVADGLFLEIPDTAALGPRRPLPLNRANAATAMGYDPLRVSLHLRWAIPKTVAPALPATTPCPATKLVLGHWSALAMRVVGGVKPWSELTFAGTVLRLPLAAVIFQRNHGQSDGVCLAKRRSSAARAASRGAVGGVFGIAPSSFAAAEGNFPAAPFSDGAAGGLGAKGEGDGRRCAMRGGAAPGDVGSGRGDT